MTRLEPALRPPGPEPPGRDLPGPEPPEIERPAPPLGEAGQPLPLSSGEQSEAASRGRSLRFKFLAFNLSIVLLSAGLLFGFWEYLFHTRSMDLLERKVDEVVAIQSSVLAVPVWNLEQDRIELILRAILKDQDFVLALVTDDSGKALARAGVPPGANSNTVTTTSAIVHGQGAGAQFLGELTLVADDQRLAALVRERLLLDLIIIVLLLTAAILAALIAFRRTIEIPLSRLLRAIYSAKHGQRNQPVVWNSADEMGVVVSEFNDLQARQARYEADLRAARDNLEQRVKERTAELQSALDAADVANKAKSEFLAVMSHELRTPLNGVLGLTDSVLAEELPRQQRERLLLVRESGSSLLELLNDLLDLSKIETGSIEFELLTFDLQALLDRVSRFWQSIIDAEGLRFVLEQPDGRAPIVHADPTRLRQVLFNLLNNAVKFTDEGEIRLRVSHSKEAGGRLLLRFEVIDSGIGIAPEAQDKLFKRFSQADSSTTRKFGGTGLGLSICRELCELMEGEVGAESEPGKGSTFWFTVRCEAGDSADAVEDPWPSFRSDLRRPGGGQRRLRILVAEDNKVNRIVIDSLVKRMGHQAHIVNNGLEAVEAVRADGARRYDLVLMDVQMPEMDGCAAAEAIRALPGPEAALPIIALTANAMRGDREKYLACGMTDYVPKPIEPQALLAAIERCVGAPSDWPCAEAARSRPPESSTGDLDERAAEGLEAVMKQLERL